MERARQLPACLYAAANPPQPTTRDRFEPGLNLAEQWGIIYANQLTRRGDLAGAGAVLAFCAGLRADGVGE